MSAAGLVAGREGQRPAGRAADADGRRDGLGVVHVVAEHERRGALGLEAEHPRRRLDEARAAVLAEAAPVGRDVAGVADRDGQVVGRVAEVLADLEGGGLLALDAVGVDGVHERQRMVGSGVSESSRTTRSASSKLPSTGDDAGARGLRLEELAGGDAAAGQDDDDLEAGSGPP